MNMEIKRTVAKMEDTLDFAAVLFEKEDYFFLALQLFRYSEAVIPQFFRKLWAK